VSALYRFFRSVRLGIVLILVIIVLSLLATLVPQGREDSYYRTSYSFPVYQLLTVTRFTAFFGSPLFYAACALLVANLSVCTVDRFARRRRAGAARRYGPDLIHIGLLLLIAGGLVTMAMRREKLYTMVEGDQVDLGNSWSLTLEKFEYLTWDNGSPRAWISTVRVEHDGAVEIPSYPIAVNKPLRLPRLQVYQVNYSLEGVLHATDPEGTAVAATTGEGFHYGDEVWYFAEVRKAQDGSWQAVFQQWRGHAVAATRSVGAGEKIGPYTLTRVSGVYQTGLKAVTDPGYLPVVIAFIIIAVGLGLTFIQKARDEKP
jgi:hypothetical protein